MSYEQQEGRRGAPMTGPATSSLGPGKRTLTEQLGAGQGPAQASDAGGDPGAPGAGPAGKDAPGASTPEGEIGELSAQRIGADPYEGADVGPDVPVRDLEGGKQEIAGTGQQLPPEGGAEALAGGAVPGVEAAGGGGGGGDGGAAGEETSAAIVGAQNDAREAIAQSQAESTAYQAEMTAKRDQFDAEQHATMLEQLKTMSSVEKRQTLQEMGYDAKAVKKLKDTEIDNIIEGKLESEQRKTKILGMTPEELAALSPAQKIQYLVDLGVDRGDLEKAGEAKATRLFDDVLKVAHVPGKHEVKIQIKGGLLSKSWVVKVNCDAEGNTDIQAEKKGGFLSKLWGWVKIALPIILTVLAPLTAGASLIVLAVYQTATAIQSGDWLGAVIGAAAALGGVSAFMVAKGALGASSTFANIASIANKAKKVAEAAQTAMAAAKAKNAGSLLGALAKGAEAFAAFSGKAADKFATTMTKWSEKLKKWSTIVTGGEKVVQGVKKGDPLAAIGGAFDTALAVVGVKNPSAKLLGRASKITGFVNAGKRALQAKPPNYAAVAEAALGIAGQLKEDRRIEDASRLVSSSNRLKQAWDKRDSDPAALVDAALGLAEAIELTKEGLEHPETKDADGKPVPDAERTAITTRYQRAGKIVKSAGAVLKAATAKPRPNYLGGLDAATQLIADLTDSKQLDAAAVLTAGLNAWTKAVNSKDDKAIMAAGTALGEAINGLRKVIGDEHAAAKREAEAHLEPGQALPDDGGGALPPGPDGGPSAEADGDVDADQRGDEQQTPRIIQVGFQGEPKGPGGGPKPPPKQLTISGTIIEGGALSDADIDAVNAAAKTVPKQFQRYIAYASVIKVGGSLAWRANNPGNLRDAGSKIGTVSGAVGTFAVFADLDAGRAAQRALYLNKYGDKSVKDAIEKLTPSSENDTATYLDRLKAAGLDLDKDVKSQIDLLMSGVEANEGMIVGVEVTRKAASADNSKLLVA